MRYRVRELGPEGLGFGAAHGNGNVPCVSCIAISRMMIGICTIDLAFNEKDLGVLFCTVDFAAVDRNGRIVPDGSRVRL